MSAYKCPTCDLDGGWHYDDEGNASRCPNRGQTERAQAAREYEEGNVTAAKEAARRCVKDAAEASTILDANTVEWRFDKADVPEGLRPGAFTWAQGQGYIEKTGIRVMRLKKSTRHPVEQWRSLIHRSAISESGRGAGAA